MASAPDSLKPTCVQCGTEVTPDIDSSDICCVFTEKHLGYGCDKCFLEPGPWRGLPECDIKPCICLEVREAGSEPAA